MEINIGSSLAADLGIYSSHRIFRYSAGFRNLGAAFQHNKHKDEKDNTKLPASAFVGAGIVIEGEAKLGWYIECEKYFHDYM